MFKEINVKTRKNFKFYNHPLALDMLFYYVDKNVLLISDNMKRITNRMKQLNIDVCMDAYVHLCIARINYSIGKGTLIKGIKWMEPATCIEIKNKKVSFKSYMKFDFKKKKLNKDKFFKLLDVTFTRYTNQYGDNASIMLSGGLDSRLLLAYLKKANKNPLVINFGFKDSNEVKYAKQVCDLTKQDLISYELVPEDIINNLEWTFSKTEGMTNFDFGILKKVEELKKRFNIRHDFYGFLGDATLGGTYMLNRNKTVFGVVNDIINGGINKTKIFTDRDIVKYIMEKIGQTDRIIEIFVIEEVRRIRHKYNISDIKDLIFMFMFLNRGLKYIGYGIKCLQKSSKVIMPFMDIDIFKELITIPWKELENHKLYMEFYKTYFPEYAKIKCNNWNMNCYGGVRKKLINEYMYAGKEMMKSKINTFLKYPRFRKNSYVDYNYWSFTNKKFDKIMNRMYTMIHINLIKNYYGFKNE
jgi:hypothetical protein